MYDPGQMLLNFSGQMGTGVSNMVNPLIQCFIMLAHGACTIKLITYNPFYGINKCHSVELVESKGLIIRLHPS